MPTSQDNDHRSVVLMRNATECRVWNDLWSC